MSLTFEWDESKNRLNIAKHGIDFIDLQEMFDLPLLTAPDDKGVHGELRWKSIGWMGANLCLVVFSEPGEDRVRIISARKASKQEARLYGQIIRN